MVWAKAVPARPAGPSIRQARCFGSSDGSWSSRGHTRFRQRPRTSRRNRLLQLRFEKRVAEYLRIARYEAVSRTESGSSSCGSSRAVTRMGLRSSRPADGSGLPSMPRGRSLITCQAPDLALHLTPRLGSSPALLSPFRRAWVANPRDDVCHHGRQSSSAVACYRWPFSTCCCWHNA
jgi:hypothetical protein